MLLLLWKSLRYQEVVEDGKRNAAGKEVIVRKQKAKVG